MRQKPHTRGRSHQYVWVPNRGPHDYSEAERFGELHFLTEGSVNRLAIPELYRGLAIKLRESSDRDYLLISSLSTLCALSASIFTALHGKLNLLIYSDGTYLVREVVIDPDDLNCASGACD